jgi:hypothetical protein
MDLKLALWTDGFAIIPGVCSADECAELGNALGKVDGPGRRGVLEFPFVAALAHSTRLLDLVRPHVDGEPFAVRAIYFNKSADANWFVGWHQDLTIEVRERIDMPGFQNWSVKDGVPHVLPATAVMEQMLTVRLHLDDTDASNGALRVIPGSHCKGRLPADEIERLVFERSEVVCEAAVGDALLMRPLLLHASSRSAMERERRVLHMEYAADSLPGRLEWHHRPLKEMDS